MSSIVQFFDGAKKSKNFKEISSTSKNLQFLIGFKKGMCNFGYNISLIINTLLLSLVYMGGVGFTFLIAKLFGKHFLETKLSKKDSYWSNLNLKKKPIKEYYRQF